jgi:Ca2+-binding EF-hand superfamily protein
MPRKISLIPKRKSTYNTKELPCPKKKELRAPARIRGPQLKHLLKTTPFDVLELQLLRALYDRHAKNGNLEQPEFQKLFAVSPVLCGGLYKKFFYVNVLKDLDDIQNVHIVKNDKPAEFDTCTFMHFLETTMCMGPRATFHNKLLFAFKMFDVDGDGFVEQEEFEEILGATLDSTGIEVDSKVLNTYVQNGWNALMKGSGLTKLSFADFKTAAQTNGALLKPFSKTTDWMERILLQKPKRNNQSMTQEKKMDDLLEYLNDTLPDLNENEIEIIREKLRDQLIDRVSDIRIVPHSLLRNLGIAPEIVLALKENLGDNEDEDVADVTHSSISSTKTYFLFLFYAAVAFICIVGGIIAALLDKRISENSISMPLNIGRILAYMAYFFIAVIVLSSTSNIMTQ